MESYTEKLEYALDIMKEQSQYAETKNASMIVFTSASLVGVITCSDSVKKLIIFENGIIPFKENVFKAFFILLSINLILSIICSLISFFPQIKQNFLEKQDSLSLLSFESNMKFKNSKFLNLKYKSKYSNNEVFNLDLANQILNFSRIAERKYKWFRLSTYCICIGPAANFVFCIIYYIFECNLIQQ